MELYELPSTFMGTDGMKAKITEMKEVKKQVVQDNRITKIDMNAI